MIVTKLLLKPIFKTNFSTMSNFIKKVLVLCVACAASIACKQNGDSTTNYADISVGDEMIAELTAPPFVPKPVGDRPAKKLIVNMEIKEIEGEMADGVKYVYWTFGGSVPGSFIRTRVGDEVEFTLKNHPDNKLPHNIDLHAVTGPGGGAASSLVAPGHSKTFNFKCLNPGFNVLKLNTFSCPGATSEEVAPPPGPVTACKSML